MPEIADGGAVVVWSHIGDLNSNLRAHLEKSLHIHGIHLLSLVKAGG